MSQPDSSAASICPECESGVHVACRDDEGTSVECACPCGEASPTSPESPVAFGCFVETLAERYLAWASRRRNRGLFRVLQLASSEYLIRRVEARRHAS